MRFVSTKICNLYEEIVQGQCSMVHIANTSRYKNFSFLVQSAKTSNINTPQKVVSINIQCDVLNNLYLVFFLTGMAT